MAIVSYNAANCFPLSWSQSKSAPAEMRFLTRQGARMFSRYDHMVASPLAPGVVVQIPSLLLTGALIFVTCLMANAEAFTSAQRLPIVKQYWQWTNYWSPTGIDFPVGRYVAGQNTTGVLFWEKNFTRNGGLMLGFCSRSRGICQAYFADSDGVIINATGLKIRARETDRQAFERFRRQGFSGNNSSVPCPDSAMPGKQDGLLQPPGLPCVFTHGFDELSVQPSQIDFPVLTIPESTARRSRNNTVETMLRQSSLGGEPIAGCTVVVPYADERVSFVPVLSKCPDFTSVQIMQRQLNEWTATTGGVVTTPLETKRLAKKVLAHASLTLKP